MLCRTHSPHWLHKLCTDSWNPTREYAGDAHAEADAEDGRLGILGYEGGASVAREVGRHYLGALC
jgi:hypothetical protein